MSPLSRLPSLSCVPYSGVKQEDVGWGRITRAYKASFSLRQCHVQFCQVKGCLSAQTESHLHRKCHSQNAMEKFPAMRITQARPISRHGERGGKRGTTKEIPAYRWQLPDRVKPPITSSLTGLCRHCNRGLFLANGRQPSNWWIAWEHFFLSRSRCYR